MAWLAQLVRYLPSSHKVPSSIPVSAEIWTFVWLFFLSKLTLLSILKLELLVTYKIILFGWISDIYCLKSAEKKQTNWSSSILVRDELRYHGQQPLMSSHFMVQINMAWFCLGYLHQYCKSTSVRKAMRIFPFLLLATFCFLKQFEAVTSIEVALTRICAICPLQRWRIFNFNFVCV